MNKPLDNFTAFPGLLPEKKPAWGSPEWHAEMYAIARRAFVAQGTYFDINTLDPTDPVHLNNLSDQCTKDEAEERDHQNYAEQGPGL